jgi:S-adenosylmethionine:diacylglycerol 3-amino-3-carboxypropyl transferase
MTPLAADEKERATIFQKTVVALLQSPRSSVLSSLICVHAFAQRADK